MQKRLAEYNATAVPPGNKPMDPYSLPKYHEYQWINWKDLELESNDIYFAS